MRVIATVLVAAAIGVGFQANLAAQLTEDLVARAVRAYGDVDLDGTVGYLRRWFASGAGTRASVDQRRRALTYLGAAETLRGNADSAASAFERLVELDPRARMDDLLFPPEVTSRFEVVRARTKVVGVSVAELVEVRPGGTAFTAWLFASSPHQLRVALRRPEGGSVRLIYAGLIGDSLSLRWDGRDSSGAWVESGRYFLEAFSGSVSGGPQRVLQLPLEIAVQLPDTVAAPPLELPDSLLLPERRGAGPGLEALLGGLAAGVGLVVLPPLLAPDTKVEPLRFAVVGTLGLATLAGFIRDLPGGVDRENRRTNEQRRRDWRERAATLAEQNRIHRAEAMMVIRLGPAVVVRLAPP